MYAVIIDDELHGVRSLELLVQKFVTDVKVVASTTSGFDGITLINNYRPDIVFLDIDMPGLNGFEVLSQLDFRSFHLIFTTAHQQYGLKAIKESATDYLLKPIHEKDLNAAVEKVRANLLETNQKPDALTILKDIYENRVSRLVLPTRNSIDYILVQDVLYVEASSNNSIITLLNGKTTLVNKALKDYELQLCKSESHFIRIHNSFIINMNYVTRYIRENGGYAVMKNEKSIPISKHKKEEFLKLINL